MFYRNPAKTCTSEHTYVNVNAAVFIFSGRIFRYTISFCGVLPIELLKRTHDDIDYNDDDDYDSQIGMQTIVDQSTMTFCAES